MHVSDIIVKIIICFVKYFTNIFYFCGEGSHVKRVKVVYLNINTIPKDKRVRRVCRPIFHSYVKNIKTACLAL